MREKKRSSECTNTISSNLGKNLDSIILILNKKIISRLNYALNNPVRHISHQMHQHAMQYNLVWLNSQNHSKNC